MAKILKLGEVSKEEAIKECVRALDEDMPVGIPTETVYGVMNNLSPHGVASIITIKQRDPNKPFTIAISDVSQAEELAFINTNARKLFDVFLPGPLTVIVPARERVKKMDMVTLNGMVGFRMPADDFSPSLLEALNKPMILTSANISKEGSVSDPSKMNKLLLDRLALFVDSGKTELGKESTVIKVPEPGTPIILREGAVSRKDIDKVLSMKTE